jgi:hypothetical protein
MIVDNSPYHRQSPTDPRNDVVEKFGRPTSSRWSGTEVRDELADLDTRGGQGRRSRPKLRAETFTARASLIAVTLSAGGDSGDCVPGELDEFVEGRFRKTLDIAVGPVIHAVGIGYGGPDAIGLNAARAKARHV